MRPARLLTALAALSMFAAPVSAGEVRDRTADLAAPGVGVADAPLDPAAPTAPEAVCTRDSDCRLLSYKCGSCACYPLHRSSANPVCTGPGVSCLPDPCSGLRARCDVASGRCVSECRPSSVCGSACCPTGSECIGGSCALPDIFADGTRSGPGFDTQDFAIGDCELRPEEGPCINAPGRRQLLRFNTDTPNLGDGDMFLGVPGDNPDFFTFSTCHGHYHFNSYAAYSLIDATGNVVADGGKRAFCLLDLRRIGGATSARFDCGMQGIQKQWADVYGAGLPCQWIDVTCVRPGAYTLAIDLNAEGFIGETNYANNHTEVAVTVPGAQCTSDAQCRVFSDYCGANCACRPIAASCEANPPCFNQPRVFCKVDPCKGKSAYCNTSGYCDVR